jgi:uncharacterized protein (TIGR02452 family)
MNTLEFDHRAWFDAFNEAREKGNGFRELRAPIFQETVMLAQSGGYSKDGTSIKINNEAITTEFFDAPEKLQQAGSFNTTFTVLNADCLETAQLLLNAELNPCVLNMASRRNPGGGVLGGSGAQEENLFRRTNLFMSMYQFAEYANQYGLKKSEHQYPMNRNTGGIYSGNITVFRSAEHNGYALLRHPFMTSFVSVAALNHPELIKQSGQFYLDNSLVEPTKEKMRTILRIAGKYGHDSLVLGAMGCGAFANPPNHIAALFKEVFDEAEFAGQFKMVVFSIISDHNSMKAHNPYGNALPFAEVFG